MKEEIKKSYYAIIPADVRYHQKIVDGAKLLYGEITALCNDKGYCWATNDYFSVLYKVDARTIQRWLSSLSKEEFIYIDNGNRRKIFLAKKLAVNLDEIDEQDIPDEEVGKDIDVSTKKKVAKKKHDKKVAVKFSEDDLRMAELLLQKIIYNFPSFENKKVNISEWAEDMRKLREIDKASTQQIHFMINWLQGGEITVEGKPPRKFEPHEFWSKNILSARKLRKQWFDNLVPQLQDTLIKKIKKSTVTQL